MPPPSMPPARVVYSTLFFVLTMALILVARPRTLFKPDGSAKEFGTGGHDQGRTVFPLGVVVVLVAVLSLYTFAMIDLVYH